MKIGGMCTRTEAIQLFGDFDVWRAERYGMAYYANHIASSKAHYLAFTGAQLQCYAKWSEAERPELRDWLASLPVLLRGALVWWLLEPQFVRIVLSIQREAGCWPYGQAAPVSPSPHTPPHMA